MVDLDSYRRRVGGFCSGHCSYFGVKFKNGHHSATASQNSEINGNMFAFSVLFLSMVALDVLCVQNDPRIESNPGPGQKSRSFVYNSKQEEALFKSLRTKNSDIARISSHRNFLLRCSAINITPRGLTSKLPNAAGHSNETLQRKLSNIHALATQDIMSEIIKHYKTIHEKILHERENLKQQLKNITNHPRFQLLSKTLTDFYEAECTRLQTKKDGKLAALIEENNNTISPQQLWIPEMALHESERSFIISNEEISDASINAAISIMNRHSPHLFLQQCSMIPSMLVYAPLETVHIHHNNRHHFCTSSSIGGNVRIFDSLNTPPSQELMRQLTAIYSPDDSAPQSFQITIRHPQVGGKDCGLYAIAYAFDLVLGLDPSESIFDQSKMRSHLVTCFEKQQLIEFPKFRTLLTPSTNIDITRPIPDTDKWSTPTKSTPQKRKRSATSSQPIEMSNQYATLSPNITANNDTTASNNINNNSSNKNDNNNGDKNSNGSNNDNKNNNNTNDNNDNNSNNNTSNTKNNNCNKKHNNNDHTNKLTNPIDSPSNNSTSPPHKRQKNRTFINQTSTIINLSSKRQLTEAEKSVLELGLTFSPSSNKYNKEELAHDIYKFIRKLKLREFFHDKQKQTNIPIDQTTQSTSGTASFNTSTQHPPDRAESKWENKNPDWYPDEVKYCTPELNRYINDIETDLNKTLTQNETKFWNNLSNDQRQALKNLANDHDIVIKPADKGGAIVIMDKTDYEAACNTHLSNTTFYEEVASNPTSTYKTKISETADEMYKEGLIDDFENNMLKAGDQTPSFYALPKVHKQFVEFPSIRPICSGSDSPTANSSEFVDTFIKPIAQNQPSYIRDTTDFIKKTKDIITTDSDILVTMDVTSLYTNIDQQEGRSTCEHFLSQRQRPSIPTKFIITLINLILKCNTMFFNGRFSHQIKGTAMGTAMAVSFANLFMSRLEHDERLRNTA